MECKNQGEPQAHHTLHQNTTLCCTSKHLETLRKSKKLSFRKLALNCDIDHSDIKKFEKGEKNITLLTMLELAKGLGIPAKELMDF